MGTSDNALESVLQGAPSVGQGVAGHTQMENASSCLQICLHAARGYHTRKKGLVRITTPRLICHHMPGHMLLNTPTREGSTLLEMQCAMAVQNQALLDTTNFGPACASWWTTTMGRAVHAQSLAMSWQRRSFREEVVLPLVVATVTWNCRRCNFSTSTRTIMGTCT